MKKNKMVLLILILLLSVYFVPNIIKADETLSEKITEIRLGTLTKLKDANNSSLHADTELTKDSEGNYVYSFGLGCNLGENCISEEDIEYSGEITSIEYGGETLTIDQAKEKWNNPDDNINRNNRWDQNGMNSGVATFAVDGAQNSYSALYKKIGKYNNKNIDVKLTLVDFEIISIPKYTVSAPAIVFTNNQIGINVTGVKWVKVKIEFFDSETHELINVKGNTTYWDIDQNQGIIINNDSTNKGIYFSNRGLKCDNNDCTSETRVDNQLYYSTIDSDIYIFDQKSGLNSSDTNNLYNDTRNSVAYAVSEEFEGNTITRTIQYSNPIMINIEGEENLWTGHGGLFLSSKNIEIPNYTITTEVVNGTIDPDPKVTVLEWDNQTVKYSPKKGYELSEIYVDGTKVDIKNYPNEYTFSRIDKDHHIKVIYIENPNTGIESLTIWILLMLVGSVIALFVINKKYANTEI